MPTDPMTTIEAARLARVQPVSVLRAVRRGVLRAQRAGLGLPYSFRRADVLRWIAGRQQSSGPQPTTPSRPLPRWARPS